MQRNELTSCWHMQKSKRQFNVYIFGVLVEVLQFNLILIAIRFFKFFRVVGYNVISR